MSAAHDTPPEDIENLIQSKVTAKYKNIQLSVGDISEPVSFEKVFLQYYARLLLFSRKFVADESTAEDIVHGVFVKIYERNTVFDTEFGLRSYLYRSVYNACMDSAKLSRRSVPLTGDLPQNDDSEAYCFAKLENEVFDEIFRAIDSLPNVCRRIFEMSYIERLSLEEVSQRMNIALSTVKSQRQRAKKLLRERLKHLYPLFSFIFL